MTKLIGNDVRLMVATEEQAKAVGAALKRGPLALLAPNDLDGDESFTILAVDDTASPEAHIDKAIRILG